MRGRLSILVIAAALAVGLWYLLAPSDSPEVTRSDTDAPAVDEAETAQAGTEPAADSVQPSEAAADSTADGARVAESDTDTTTDVAQTSDPGATLPVDDTPAADSGSDPTADVAQTSDPDATLPVDDTPAAGSGADPTADVAQTADPGATQQVDDTPVADSGADSTADVTQTSDPDPTQQVDDTPVAGSGADPTTNVAQTSDPGATQQVDDTPVADSGADPTADVAQTSDPGATPGEDGTLAAGSGSGSGADSAADAAPTPESVAMAAPEVAPATGADPLPPADAAGATDSDAVEAEPRMATGAPGRSVTGEVVLAPATDGTIERTPIAPADTPPADETGPEDVLAAVAGGIEAIRSAIEETLGIEPENDADTALRLRIEYDDTPKEDPQTGLVANDPQPRDLVQKDLDPKEGAATTAADSTAAADVAQTTNTGTESPAGDAPPPPDVARTPDTGAESPADPAPAIGSGETPSTTPLRTADSGEAPLPNADRSADAGATGSEGSGAEAKRYVETLTATTPPTIPVDNADHFVTQDSVVSLVPEDSIESTTVDELADDDTLTPNTPITVVREIDQIETAVPEQLIADSGGDLDRPLRVVVTYDDSQKIDKQGSPDGDVAAAEDTSEPIADTTIAAAEDISEPIADTTIATAEDTAAQEADEPSGVEVITVREALERIRTEPEKPLSIIRTVRHFEVMTLRELLISEEDDGAFLRVVMQPYRIEAATLADLLRLHKTESPDTISYLHTVQPTDEQGIWGIVHFGLIENFARGMAVRRGEKIETYTVQIPRDADERLEDRSSSFLGRLIDRKTKESYVYNFRDNRMGRNPDTIYPGQEIVIINFEPGELESIYEHFAGG